MNIEKYQQYANSKLKADKMRKEIKETVDNYQTAQTMGYEAAKVKYKPLLEAQVAQTKAQEAQAAAQTAMMKQIVPFQKTEVEVNEGISEETREFLQNFNFPLPSLLLMRGLRAYEKGEKAAANWREEMLHLSIEVTQLIKETDDPAIINPSTEYKEQIQKIAAIVTKKTPKTASSTPEIMADKGASTSKPKQGKIATSNFNLLLNLKDKAFLKNNNYAFPNEIFQEGLNIKQNYPEEDFDEWVESQLQFRDELAEMNKGKGFNASRKKYYDQIQLIIDSFNVIQTGQGLFMNPQDLFKKLELITGSILAGNTSNKIRNDAYKILDKLLEIGLITKTIYNKYIKEYLKH